MFWKLLQGEPSASHPCTV